MKEKIQKFREYLDYIEEHYDNVQKAWALINEKCPKNKFRFLYDDFVWHSIDTEVKSQHHWQNWTAIEKGNPYADMFLVMNIVDWVAMGLKFNDTAKDYYEKNKHEINLPNWAVKLMYEIFDCIY